MIDDLQHLLAKTLPLPKRKPNMGEKKLAKAQPEEAPKPAVTGRLQPVETETLAVVESVKQGALLAAVSVPLPKRKPQQLSARPLSEHAAVEAKKAEEKVSVATAEPKLAKAEKSERALSSTFVNGLRKIYGNRVSATLGAERSYGYIVD